MSDNQTPQKKHPKLTFPSHPSILLTTVVPICGDASGIHTVVEARNQCSPGLVFSSYTTKPVLSSTSHSSISQVFPESAHFIPFPLSLSEPNQILFIFWTTEWTPGIPMSLFLPSNPSSTK